MREMELWRDKVQLRIRDRIQTSVRSYLGFQWNCELTRFHIDGAIHKGMPGTRRSSFGA